MNKAPQRESAPQVLQMMAEGIALRAITRLTGISRTTLQKLLEDAGQAFAEYQDRVSNELAVPPRPRLMRHGHFATRNRRNVPTAKKGPGRRWRYLDVGLDWMPIRSWPCPFTLAAGDSEAAEIFINDLAKRVANRVQLTSDGHRPYLEAIEGAFGAAIDYATLVKVVWRKRRKVNAAIVPQFARARTSIASKAILIQSMSARRL